MNYETDLRNPINITIENKTGINQAIRYFDCNFQDVLAPEDSVIITATSSERLAYYTKLKEELEINEGTTELTSKDYVIKTLEFLQVDTKKVEIPEPDRIEEDFVVGFDIGNESIPEASYTKYSYELELPTPDESTVSTSMEVYMRDNIAISLTALGNGQQKIKFEDGNITNEFYEQNSN